MQTIHGPLGSLLGMLGNAARSIDRTEHNVNQSSIIAGRLRDNGLAGRDAAQLARILAYYPDDALHQARVIAMLKQMGYLQNQAY